MKRVMLWLAGLGGTAVLWATIFVVNLLFFKPFLINHFFERVFLEFAISSPEILTSTRTIRSMSLSSRSSMRRASPGRRENRS